MIKVGDVMAAELSAKYPPYRNTARRTTRNGTQIEETFGMMLDGEIKKLRDNKTA